MSTRSTESNTVSERVSPKTAADMLGVSVWTVYRLIRRKQLRSARVGYQHQVFVSGINALLAPEGGQA